MYDKQYIEDLKKELKNYYEMLTEQKLAAQKYKIEKTTLHCINEIRLCINRENPNIQMALSRLDQIEDLIKNL